MNRNLSIKTPLLVQGLLVRLLIPIEIFFGEVNLDYVVPLYMVVWIWIFSKVSKSEDQKDR